MADLHLDFEAMNAAESQLRLAAELLDGAGSDLSLGGHYGHAAGLVEGTLAMAAEACAHIVGETQVLSLAVGLCRADMEQTDSDRVLDLFRLEADLD